MHWAAAGPPDAPALVLLPKLGGWADDFAPIAPHLTAAGFQVVAVDSPGHGDSAMDADPPWCQTMEASADLLATVIRELGAGRPIVGGNSLGGCIALATAARHPDLASGLVLISCATSPAMTEADLRKRQADHPDPDFTPDGMPLPRDFERMATINGNRDRATHEAMERSRQKAGRWILPSERGVALADFPGFLAAGQSPTLLLYGDQETHGDRFGPPAMAELGRRGSMIQVPGAGRFPHQERPAQAAAAIGGWIRATR